MWEFDNRAEDVTLFVCCHLSRRPTVLIVLSLPVTQANVMASDAFVTFLWQFWALFDTWQQTVTGNTGEGSRTRDTVVTLCASYTTDPPRCPKNVLLNWNDETTNHIMCKHTDRKCLCWCFLRPEACKNVSCKQIEPYPNPSKWLAEIALHSFCACCAA